ncbi:hypothetical protein OG216_20435 [Streptomycetaceae bacterium NBC_01309]
MSTYDIEELRQAMAERADDAPDALGVLAAAHETAARRRHRRRTFQATGVAAALAAIAVVTPTALGALDDGSGENANPAASEPAAEPFGMQLTLRPNDRSYAMLVAAGTTTQHMEIRGKGNEPNGRPSASAILHAPGAFDASKVLNGERVTVNGHAAYYVAAGETVIPPNSADLPEALRSVGPTKTMPLLAWEAAPGQWVTVEGFFSVTAEDLLWLAEQIEIKTPALPTSPFHLGYLPADLVAQGTLTHNNDRASLAFGTPSQPLAGNWGRLGMPDFNETLLIDAMAVTTETLPAYQARLAQLGPSTKLSTYDSWYSTEENASDVPGALDQPHGADSMPTGNPLPTSATPGQGATLTVMTPNCHVQFSVADKNRIPRAELEKIALATDFKDCTNPSTWVRPIP